ncbi:hypothetical protein CASFOL_017961 [Castilleja foliolosa]|uniref:Phytocyanin domain-containing protein n=1 Tax=Castilleja foliolosa TaxID=1961234 RepID=A0ABD3DCI3_9LAMI
MVVKFAGSLVLLLVATSVLAIAMANPNMPWPWWPGQAPYCWLPCDGSNITKKEIVVGGDQPRNSWRFGYNYSDWAMKNAPFYLNDILVFKYDEPVPGRFYNHSVYMLRDFPSYINCSLEGATLLGDVYAGDKDGFNLELKIRPFGMPYFLACGEKNGFHCNLGMMKFVVWPMFRPGFN